ncbi:MAG: M64 family metallopeptidase [Nitrospira sp.]|nr:M64 family metallopeptidase [Nitrospira sp.]
MSILIMGDGYAEADMNAYGSQVTSQVLGALRLDQLLLHQGALRVVRADLVSVESAFESDYNARGTIISDVFRSSRLGLIPNDSWDRCWFDMSTFTDARIEKLRLRFAPDADHVIVLVKSDTWGGCSSVGPGTGYFTEGSGMATVAHEMGHNLFALGDEYVSDAETFTGVSGYPNTSETPSDWTTLKWFDLVAPNTPLPTNAARPPAGWNRRTSVGAFEGAGGSYATGLFRPVLECRMNQNNPPWCPVCGRKILSDLEVFE